MRVVNYTCISSADITSNQTSAAIESEYLFQASAHVIMTGSSPVGTVKIQISNDKPGPAGNPVNWVDLSGASVAINATGGFLIPKTEICYAWIRFFWTFTSGTGTVTVKMQGLGE